MKLIFMSDIHLMEVPSQTNFQIDPRKLSDFISYCKELKGDYLIINGDLSSNPYMNERIKYEINKENKIKIILIPGNHEVYQGQAGSIGNFYKEYRQIIPYKRNFIDTLIPLNDEWSLLPALGTYDALFETDLSVKEIVDGLGDDSSLKKNIVDKNVIEFLEEQIRMWQGLMDYSGNKKIIFAQHFVPNEDLLKKKDGSVKFQAQSRMIGSKKIEEFIKRNEKIKIAHFGHTHITEVDKVIDGVRYICQPVGYTKEVKNFKNYHDLFKRNTVQIKL